MGMSLGRLGDPPYGGFPFGLPANQGEKGILVYCINTSCHGSKTRTPSEHPNPHKKIDSKMSGAPTSQWDPIGFDNHGHMFTHIFPRISSFCVARLGSPLFSTNQATKICFCWGDSRYQDTLSNSPP